MAAASFAAGIGAPAGMGARPGTAGPGAADGQRFYEDLLTHQAAVFFPYEVMLAAVMELHFKNMPLFLPTSELGLFYVFRGPTNCRFGCGVLDGR